MTEFQRSDFYIHRFLSCGELNICFRWLPCCLHSTVHYLNSFTNFKVPITTQNIRASVTPALDISMTIIFYY
jgi:hypothetical protein